MKRLHVSVTVEDLQSSVDFYSTLFGQEPSVRRDDYAKWMLDDPCVNFAIDTNGEKAGVDHLGIQVSEGEELTEISARLNAARVDSSVQEDASCCYARGDKRWVEDPQGIPWETFRTKGESTVYGEDTRYAISKCGDDPEDGSCG
jgi:catechol 2,3-dioxygenase-like lactoylglutathione lyase family enzyme